MRFHVNPCCLFRGALVPTLGLLAFQRRLQWRYARYRGPIPSAPRKDSASVLPPVDCRVQSLTASSVVPSDESAGRANALLPSSGGSAMRSIDGIAVSDINGMPLELEDGVLTDFGDFDAIMPKKLAAAFREHRKCHEIKVPTPVQSVAIPSTIVGRDIICIAPTASGKTLAYLAPTIGLLLRQNSQPDFSIQPFTESVQRSKERRDVTCRYCGMDMTRTKICAETGHAHPPVFDAPLTTPEGRRQAFRQTKFEVAAPGAIILAPTSELVAQIVSVAKDLACGLQIGHIVRANREAVGPLELPECHESDVVVSTPVQLAAAIMKGLISLRMTKAIVFDEPDHLLQKPTLEAVEIILRFLPKRQRPQRLFFGATLPMGLKESLLSPKFVSPNSFRMISVQCGAEGGESVNMNVTHHVLMVSGAEKIDKIAEMYRSGLLRPQQRVIVYCNSKSSTWWIQDRMNAILDQFGARVARISGSVEPARRAEILHSFNVGLYNVLVATDICSRGLDFKHVECVIHFDLPSHFVEYIHRCGRCGRHGNQGHAYSLFQPEDAHLAKSLVKYLVKNPNPCVIPPKLKEYAAETVLQLAARTLPYSTTRSHRSPSQQRHKNPFGSQEKRYLSAHQRQSWAARGPVPHT